METAAAAPASYPDLSPEAITEPLVIDAPTVPTAVVRLSGVPMAGLGGHVDAVFGTAFPALFRRGVTPSAAPFALYRGAPEGPDGVVDVEIGFPLAHPLAEPMEVGDVRIEASELPAGRTAVVSHLGDYAGLGAAWGGLMERVGAHGLAPGLPFWECYVTEPSPDTDPATLRTDLFCPVATPDDAA